MICYLCAAISLDCLDPNVSDQDPLIQGRLEQISHYLN